VAYLNWNSINRQRNLNLNRIESDWNGNWRFLAVRKSPYSSVLFSGGSFFFNFIVPTAEHPADLIRIRGNGSEFYIIKRIDLPSYLQEKFQQVASVNGIFNGW